MSGMSRQAGEQIARLQAAGISYQDASALRLIAITLNNWFALECGNSNDYGAWAIVRGRKEGSQFIHDDDGKPFVEHHHYLHGKGKDYTTYTGIPDREAGAMKRLIKIMARYRDPMFKYYVQTDPRGAALYILRPDDIREDQDISTCYTNGVALFK